MSKIDLDRLLKLRLTVARYGEMDLARWWNTKQLGPNGAKVLRRGFPRTYHFAQARASFAVAVHRFQSVPKPSTRSKSLSCLHLARIAALQSAGGSWLVPNRSKGRAPAA